MPTSSLKILLVLIFCVLIDSSSYAQTATPTTTTEATTPQRAISPRWRSVSTSSSTSKRMKSTTNPAAENNNAAQNMSGGGLFNSKLQRLYTPQEQQDCENKGGFIIVKYNRSNFMRKATGWTCRVQQIKTPPQATPDTKAH